MTARIEELAKRGVIATGDAKLMATMDEVFAEKKAKARGDGRAGEARAPQAASAFSMRASAWPSWSMPAPSSSPACSAPRAAGPRITTARRPTARSRASAKIDGRECAVVANDFTVMGASSGATNGRKIGHMKRVATSRGLPMVFLGESLRRAHARPHGRARHGRAAGQRPDAVCPHARDAVGVGDARASPTAPPPGTAVLSDFCVLRKGAVLAVSSAQLASLAIKEEVDPAGDGRLAGPCRGDRLRRLRSPRPTRKRCRRSAPSSPTCRAITTKRRRSIRCRRLRRQHGQHRQAAARAAHAGLRRAHASSAPSSMRAASSS